MRSLADHAGRLARASFLAAIITALSPAAAQISDAPDASPPDHRDQPPANPSGLRPDIQNRITSLLNELSHESWQTRQKAQDELVLLGHDAHAILIDTLRHTEDEEVRARVDAALAQIELNRTTGQSIVSLYFQNASPADVFAELFRQANADLRTTPPNLWETRPFPPIDVDIDRQPFWAAMKQICDQVGVTPQNGGAGREMVLADRAQSEQGWGRAPSIVSGPFLVTAKFISFSSFIDFKPAPERRRACNIQFQFYAEPKLRVLQGSHSARLDEAIDDTGGSLLPPLQYDNMQPRHDWIWSLSAALIPQPQTGSRIASIKGGGRFIIQTRSQTAEIEDVLAARSVTRSVDGKRFTLKEVRRNGNQYIVHLTLYRAGWTPQEWNYMYPYHNFRLIDAKGTPLQRTTTGNSGGSADQIDITLHFQQNPSNGDTTGEPVKLLWEVTTETQDLLIPFEFADILLPTR